MLRNDAAHAATQVPVSEFLPTGGDEQGAAAAATMHACAGRVLVLKTKPVGAPGEVWHVNVYQHTSNAPVRSRRQVWAACSAVTSSGQRTGGSGYPGR